MEKKRIGIAGYMGAGKSTVAHLLASKDCFLINADAEAKRVMNGDQFIRDKIKESFGEDCVVDDCISSDILGKYAFESLDNLKKLNEIVHPSLLEDLQRQIENYQGTCCILDAALIPLWPGTPELDICIWVEASFETRLQRVLKKDLPIKKELIEHRMHLQQQLFEPPRGSLWLTVINEAGVEFLQKTVEELRIQLQIREAL